LADHHDLDADPAFAPEVTGQQPSRQGHRDQLKDVAVERVPHQMGRALLPDEVLGDGTCGDDPRIALTGEPDSARRASFQRPPVEL
jgi:hypothetical protein